MRLFVVAGEPSGDMLGGALLNALQLESGSLLEFAGVGGEEMRRAGLASLFPLSDIAVMGFLSVVPRLPMVLRRMRETIAAMLAFHPDALVTIDAPSFTLRVARRAKAAGIPVIHYVAPQYWGWRPGRLRKLPHKIDHLLALFPFEPAFFAAGGVSTTYVGHPAIERLSDPGDGRAFRSRHGIDADARLLAVLPGSRVHLVRRMLPIFAAALAPLLAARPIHLVLPVVEAVQGLVADAVRRFGWRATLVGDSAERAQALAASDAALTVSGTITLELALAGTPMVVTYRTDELSARIARRLILTRWVSLPNLVADAPLVPELLQWDCTPEAISRNAARLLDDPAERARQRAGFAAIRQALGSEGLPPSRRAAREILEFVASRGRVRSA
jgi:lipid-A-disaccharide synthase